jgi:Transport and Golgi organisation 2
MCTVVYVPTKQGFLVSSIRDEQFLRPHALPPKQQQYQQAVLLYPTDTQAGGTWIVADQFGKVSILFNGGFEKHVSTPPYAKSRGLVLLDLVSANHFTTAWNEYDLQKIEPFSVVQADGDSLIRCTWDGLQKSMEVLDHHQSYMWSSATLYNEDQRSLRQHIFHEWLQQNTQTMSPDVLISFFETAMPDDAANRFVMNRNNVLGSVSFTACMVQQEATFMQYHHLVTGQVFSAEIKWKRHSTNSMQ